jgi:ectoine hydroxylase-related dioxygenase (phytanoyl-CoA dioxygenase family)
MGARSVGPSIAVAVLKAPRGQALGAFATIDAVPASTRTVDAGAPVAEIVSILRDDGCVVISGLVAPALMDQVTIELEPYIAATGGGRREFLGHATRRVGALIARSPSARALVAHPTILDILDLMLCDHGSTFQVDLTQLVDIGPGEPAQTIHRDQWSFDHFPFPTGFEAEISTMWAATEFTEEMGATRVIVGSNRWQDDPTEVDPALTTGAVMGKGSVLVYTGSLFHGGGANTTDIHRIGINLGYSLGWLRQEENQYLACPPDIARTLPEGLLRLMGYQRGSFALGYVDDIREPLDWLYDQPASGVDFLAYRRTARKLLKRTGMYTVPPTECSDATTLGDSNGTARGPRPS